MAFQKVKKLLGISAVVICCGTVMFTFTGCGDTKQPVAETVQMEEMAEVTEDKDGGAIANDIDLNLSDNEVKAEEDITVTYLQSKTESDTMKMINGEQVDYKIKDYEPAIFFEYMQDMGYECAYDEEQGIVYNGENVISENAEIDEEGHLLVRDVVLGNGNIPVVKYIRMSDTEVEARYIGGATKDSGMVSGITFVFEKNESGEWFLNGLLGVFGEDISKLPVYSGTFDGWAMELDGDVVYEVGDEVKISGDMELYPHFLDDYTTVTANPDGTMVEGQLETIDGKTVLRVVHINGTKKDKDGNIVATKKYALDGLDAKKDKVKGVDPETVEKQQTEDPDPSVKEPTEPTKPAEQPKKPADQPKPASGQNENKPSQDPNGGQDTPSNFAPSEPSDSGADAWGAVGGGYDPSAGGDTWNAGAVPCGMHF